MKFRFYLLALLLAAARANPAPPGVVIDVSPSPTTSFVGSPSIAILPDGTYVASHDFFGTKSSRLAHTRVFGSSDRGRTWTLRAELSGQFWSSLFVYRGALYLLGTEHEYGDILIRRSLDEGRTWTTPADSRTGRLFPGTFHCAPTPVVVHGGRIWRAFEHYIGADGAWSGRNFETSAISAAEGTDLLNAASWRRTNGIRFQGDWVQGARTGWLEGNVVAAPGGRMVTILRINAQQGPHDPMDLTGPSAGIPRFEVAAMVDLSSDGAAAAFDPAHGFIRFPGSQSKFTIRYDERSHLYWSLANVITNPNTGAGVDYSPEWQRNVLALTSSPDLRHWTQRSIVLRWREGLPVFRLDRVAFQYPDWQFDGDDLIAVARTAWGAPNYHNANYLTFHRIAHFRDLTMADSAPPLDPNFGRGSKARPLAATLDPLPERQLTHDAVNHDLDNNDNFSPHDDRLVYDTRASDDAIGANATIAQVDVRTGETQVVYQEPAARSWGPGVAAANFNPVNGAVDFIRGLSSASAGRPYEMWRRSGAMVSPETPGMLRFLDARDVIAPYTAGAMRGGTHRHEWSGDGRWIGFTYNDAVLADVEQRTGRKVNLRTIGVATRLDHPVRVPSGPENHDGEMFAAIVARVVPEPKPGSDEVSRAFEDAWVGTGGYRRADGRWQQRARAFLGTVRGKNGAELAEVFLVDIPERIDVPGEWGPLQGGPEQMPMPPRGTVQRRLTFTADRKYPGVALLPRHWVRSSPDGERIVYLAKDDAGVVQAFVVSPRGGPAAQVSHENSSIQSCARWSPQGDGLLYVCGNALTICDVRRTSPGFGVSRVLTTPSAEAPENPVWSHDGRTIAFNRRVSVGGKAWQQIFTLKL